jgi:hypothetical protein
MAYGFMFRFELEDGTPADPPMFRSAPACRGAPATRSRWVEGRFAWSRSETTTQINLRRWWLKRGYDWRERRRLAEVPAASRRPRKHAPDPV